MKEAVGPASLFVLIALMSSVAVLSYLFQRHQSGLPLIAYEPRRRVPWGPSLAMLALTIPLLSVLGTLAVEYFPNEEPVAVEEHVVVDGDEKLDPAEDESTEFIWQNLSMAFTLIALVVVLGAGLRAVYGANRRDLGLPTSGAQLREDFRSGAIAFFASIVPISVLMLLLSNLLQPETEHPLIDELQQSHTSGMMLAALFMVSVAAPLFEETAFRLLLQGWLEKWEDEQLKFTATARVSPPVDEEQSEEVLLAEAGEPIAEPAPVIPPLRGVLPDLPHGWMPILVSGTLFGLAHLGQGVSPVPLVLFGLVLGYLYQRTHRITPSIFAHALFNTYSMVMLWLGIN